MIDIEEDVLIKEPYPNEALLVACFYDNPQLYYEYDNRLTVKHFGNEIWKFYFKIGELLYSGGAKVLDDLTVANKVNELKANNTYEKFNRYETIKELVNEIQIHNKKDNLELYYDEVKKYYILRKFRDLFGDKVVEKNGKYDYKLLSGTQIANYWLYQVEEIGIENDRKFDEEFLLEGLKEEVEKQHNSPETGMPFYNSRILTKITNGWVDGELYLFAMGGGKGKTSFILSKHIVSCIYNNEKLLVIANEESITRFRRNLLITIMGNITNEWFLRQRINEGKFSIEEYQRLENAIEWVSDITEGNNKLITFVYMENYVMQDVKKIITHYSKIGYRKIIVDTAKVSEGRSNMARWEVITEDMKDLYKLCKKNANGLGVSIWANCQLADQSLKNRYLNEYSLGESKKMKNEASVLYMMRLVWDDELEGGDHELNCYHWIKNEETEKWDKEEFKLSRHTDHQYYLLFTPKNRLGRSSETGEPQLIFEVDLNRNKWKEIGQTFVIDDHQYGN